MSVPVEDNPIPLSRPVKGGRDRAATAVAVGIVVFVIVGVLKPWNAIPSPTATPSASPGATVAHGPPVRAIAGPTPAGEPVTVDRPVAGDAWRRVGPPPQTDAILAAVHSGIDAIDPDSGLARPFLTCSCDLRGSLAVSRSGTSLAYGDALGGTTYIRTLVLATLDSSPVVRCDACARSGFDLGWSPDGQWLAFAPGVGGIWEVAVDGSVLRQVLSTGRSPTFSPDGTRLLVDGVATVNVDGTGFTPLGLGWAFGTAWSPEGSRLAFAATASGPSTQAPADDPFVRQLWVADSDGSHRVRVAELPGCCVDSGTAGPVWSPDGTHLVWPARLRHGLEVVAADGTSSRDLTVEIGLLPVRPAWLRVTRAASVTSAAP